MVDQSSVASKARQILKPTTERERQQAEYRVKDRLDDEGTNGVRLTTPVSSAGQDRRRL